MKNTDIYRIYGTDYKNMTKHLLEETALAERIPAGACVGIKPNLVSPTPAEYGATTHPQVVAGLVEYLQEHGITNLLITEGSWIGDKTTDAYEYCGYRSLCETYGVEFLDAQKDGSHKVDCDGMLLKICNVVDRIDYMINVPVLKGHGQTKITCALKNMKGLIPNTEKRHFHTMGLHQPIAHLSRGIHQDFILVDHICGDLELEDGGNPIVTNCVMAALDPVLLDTYVCDRLGFQVEEVPYIGMAHALGSGSMDLEACTVKTILRKKENDSLYTQCMAGAAEDGSHEDETYATEPSRIHTMRATDVDPFEARRNPSDALLEISYAIEDADSCSACYASLAPAILRLKEEGLWEKIEANLPGKIAIGQGFAGKTGVIGVGNCCRKFDIHVPGCPPEEEDVYTMLRGFAQIE